MDCDIVFLLTSLHSFWRLELNVNTWRSFSKVQILEENFEEKILRMRRAKLMFESAFHSFLQWIVHYVKSLSIRSFSGPHFPAFGLNTERYSLCFRIQPEYEKVRTTKTLNKDTFHAVFTMQLYTEESEIINFQQRMIIMDS